MIISKALHNRLQKKRNSINCYLKSIRSINHPVLAEKGLPLYIFISSFMKVSVKAIGWIGMAVWRVEKVFSIAVASVLPSKSNW